MLIATWIVTFVIIVGIGVWSGTKIKSANQWSGGDKTMGPLTLGCVFAAWQIGGMAVVGAAQNGYTLGISGAWYSIAGSFYFIALALFAKLIRNNMPGDSVPIYLQKRFDTKTSRLYSYAWIVYGFLYIPYQLKTVASIIQLAIPGLNITLAMLIGLTIAVIYTSFSGMRGMSAVGRIVCFGIYILLIAFVLMTLPKFGGFTVMLSELPAEYSSMGNMPTQRIIAWILGGCLSTAVMQSVLQPLLAAKSASAARTGSILGYVLAAPICLLTATCGIFAKASGADLGDGATAFAYSIRNASLLAGRSAEETPLLLTQDRTFYVYASASGSDCLTFVKTSSGYLLDDLSMARNGNRLSCHLLGANYWTYEFFPSDDEPHQDDCPGEPTFFAQADPVSIYEACVSYQEHLNQGAPLETFAQLQSGDLPQAQVIDFPKGQHWPAYFGPGPAYLAVADVAAYRTDADVQEHFAALF